MAEKPDEDVNNLITVREERTNVPQGTPSENLVPNKLVDELKEWVRTCNKVSILAAGKQELVSRLY